MRVREKVPARKFVVGANSNIEISDVAEIDLAPNEQVTFVTDSGRRHDFVRKDWGFYVTPSLNGRLQAEGFRSALVKNQQGRIYLMTIEQDKLAMFSKYCDAEQQTVIQWLDGISS